MALPSDLTTITVTGTYTSITGVPLSGQVNFSLTTPVEDSTGKVIFNAFTQPAVLNSSGSMSIVLPCTDNTDLNPVNFSYLVTEVIPGLGRAYYVQLPHTLGSTVDLSSLAPVAPPPSASAFGSNNTWTGTQTFDGSPPVKIPAGAASGDVLTSDASGNASWQVAPVSGITPPAGDIGGSTSAPTVVSTHLASPLPQAQGGLGNTTGTAVNISDTLDQVPAPAANVSLNSHKITSLANGSAAQDAAAFGQVPVIDSTATDIQPLGVQAAGASGKAADAKHVHPYQAWQFLPESYGAKRDGAYLYDAAITSGSAVLTTAGLPAPAAPSVANSASGGTVLAGVYQVKVSYVNAHGETLASSSTSVTTTGSTSTITVTSPGSWTNATAYYVYCTQAGGSTYTRQQTAGNPTPLILSYVISAPPTSSGANPPGANTSSSAPFTSADVGKHIVIPSAGGFLNVPLTTTIASFQSATQVTLAATASSTVTGNGAVYGTDDTAAIQAAINAAVAYAQTAGTEEAIAEVLFSDGIYCIAGALGGTYQNAQIQIPYVDAYVGPKVNLALTGPLLAGGPVHWQQPNPPAAGATLASMRYSDADLTGPPPACVIGGPVQNAAAGLFFGGVGGGLWSNMRVIVDGINVLVPYRSSCAGLDLFGVGQADIKSFSYYCMARTLGGSAGGWPPYESATSNPSAWQTFGYRCPTTGNNDRNTCDRLTIYGPYYAVLFTDHFTAVNVAAIFCYAAAVAVPNVTAGTAHHCFIASLSSEATSRPLIFPVDGVYTDTPTPQNPASLAVTISSLHVENADIIIDDASSSLYGDVRAEALGLTGLIPGGKNGAANIRLVWDYQPLGLQGAGTAPAVPASGTVVTNTFWHDALVMITSGGAAVTAMAVDGAVTGLTLGTTGTVTVPVPNGQTITLTYASTAPTWKWVLS